MIADTGLTPGLLTDPGPRSEVVRLELLLSEVLGESDVPGAFRELLRQRAAAPEVVVTDEASANPSGDVVDAAAPETTVMEETPAAAPPGPARTLAPRRPTRRGRPKAGNGSHVSQALSPGKLFHQRM